MASLFGEWADAEGGEEGEWDGEDKGYEMLHGYSDVITSNILPKTILRCCPSRISNPRNTYCFYTIHRSLTAWYSYLDIQALSHNQVCLNADGVPTATLKRRHDSGNREANICYNMQSVRPALWRNIFALPART